MEPLKGRELRELRETIAFLKERKRNAEEQAERMRGKGLGSTISGAFTRHGRLFGRAIRLLRQFDAYPGNEELKDRIMRAVRPGLRYSAEDTAAHLKEPLPSITAELEIMREYELIEMATLNPPLFRLTNRPAEP